MKQLLLLILKSSHFLILTFVLMGWALPWEVLRWVHLGFIPLLVLHWRTNQNRCCLTSLESKLQYGDQATEGQFIKSVWLKIFGRLPSDQTLERLVNGSMILSWLLSAWSLSAAQVF